MISRVDASRPAAADRGPDPLAAPANAFGKALKRAASPTVPRLPGLVHPSRAMPPRQRAPRPIPGDAVRDVSTGFSGARGGHVAVAPGTPRVNAPPADLSHRTESLRRVAAEFERLRVTNAAETARTQATRRP